MTAKEKKDIKEFLQKEDERFKLVRLGFFSDIDSETEYLCANFRPLENESFAQWKVRILCDFYSRKDFSTFCRNNIGNVFFERAVKSLITAELHETFMKSEKTDTDKFLAPVNDTISYALSEELFEHLYHENFTDSVSFSSTKDLDIFCREKAGKSFPIEEGYVVERLQGNDNFYWNKVYTRLRPMTAGFSYQISGRYTEDSIHDIWSDTCYILNLAIVGEKLQKPTSARDIISYAVGIIKNKNKEWLRNKKKDSKIDIDSITYKLTDETEEHYFNNPETVPMNFPSQDEKITNYIDIHDEEAVRNYMVVVLYNEQHPLHKKLVAGIEDKVKLMFEHYVDDLSYEDIVTKYYGKVSEEDMVRHAARIRQDVKRVKERLVKRFETILKSNK